MAHQDFRTINLWGVDASVVFEQAPKGLPDSLLPFVPVLRGGGEVAVVTQAVARLRSIETPAELEPLLAFFTSFVMETGPRGLPVRAIMRWDMAVLRESPWYAEILQEGVQQGIERGIEQGIEQGEALMLVHMLRHRFGSLPQAVEERLRDLATDQLQRLAVIAWTRPPCRRSWQAWIHWPLRLMQRMGKKSCAHHALSIEHTQLLVNHPPGGPVQNLNHAETPPGPPGGWFLHGQLMQPDRLLVDPVFLSPRS